MTHFSYSDPFVNAVLENDRSLRVTIMRDLNALCRQMQLLMSERVVNWLCSAGTTRLNSFLLLFIISSTSPFPSSSFCPSSFFLFLFLILLFLFSLSSSSSFCPSSFFLFLIHLFLFSFSSSLSFCSYSSLPSIPLSPLPQPSYHEQQQ